MAAGRETAGDESCAGSNAAGREDKLRDMMPWQWGAKSDFGARASTAKCEAPAMRREAWTAGREAQATRLKAQAAGSEA